MPRATRSVLYLRAIRKELVEMVIGVLFAIGGFIWQIAQWTSPALAAPAFAPWMLYIPGIGMLGVATFKAWEKEYERAELADGKLVAALLEISNPKLQIATPIVQRTPVVDVLGNRTGEAIYVQLPVACLSDVAVPGCCGQLVSVFKWRDNVWEPTALNEAMLLYWSNTYAHPPESVTIYPGVPRNLNVLRVLSTNQVIEPQIYGTPTRMENLFDSGKFRFDIAVASEKGKTIHQSVAFQVGNRWDAPAVCEAIAVITP